MKRCAIPLVLLSFVGMVSELSATVTARHYDFEGGVAGANAAELVDITTTAKHENSADFFGWGSHIWIEVSGIEARPLPAGSLPEVVEAAALVAPSLLPAEGQGKFADVSDGSQFDSPAIGSKLAIQFDGNTRYDDSTTASGSRGVYINPTAYANGSEVTGNVSESFNLMLQGWVYPQQNNGQKQTVWQAGNEQGSVNITEDGFWQFEDLGSVGVLNCPQVDGLDKPYSCEQGQFPVAFNQWTHLGILRGGNGAEIYLNGVLVAGNRNPDPPNFFGGFANQITLGSRSDGTNGFKGLVDDFKVQGEVNLGPHDMDYNLIPSKPGDFNGDGKLDAADIDGLSDAVRAGNNPAKYDVTGDGKVDSTDRETWINTLRKTYAGDANLDGEFSSADFVSVFGVGEYEDATANNSTWADGDWDGNGDFESGDFVFAFASGGYELGPRAAVAAVPEPASLTLLCLAGLSLLGVRRRS